MSKVFFPIRYEDVRASEPHGGNPAYRVAFGMEHWADGSPPTPVYKVQMVYDGIVAGRKSPSYPQDSDDFERVIEAMRRLKAGLGESGRGMSEVAGNEPGMSLLEAQSIMNAGL